MGQVAAIDTLLSKAERSLEVAENIFALGSYDFAASRAYYGYFYIAEALLLTMNLEGSSHREVISQYGRYFAKPERLPRHFHQKLLEAFRLRQTGDYSFAEQVYQEDAEEVIREGWAFLRAARAYLSE